MKHFFHANACSPPPPKPTRAGGACLRLLLALMLALVPGMSWASFHFYDDVHSYNHHPTVEEPNMQFVVCFYDAGGYDSFFLHDATEGSNAGPALYVDGHYICSPDYEFAWPGSNGSGNQDGIEDQRKKYDGWWGNTYTKSINGQLYTVKFWNPYRSGDRYYVTVHVFIDKMRVEEQHTVKIKGKWRINRTSTQFEERSWTFNAIPNPFKESTLAANYIDYTNATLTGKLNTSYENNVAVAREYRGGYINGKPYHLIPDKDNNFSGWKTFAKGSSQISKMPFYIDQSYSEYPRTLYVQHQISVPAKGGYVECKVWSSTWINLPDFSRAEKITATPDMWKKQVTLTWETANLKNEFTTGTWTIYRYPVGNPTAKVPIVEKLLNTTRKYVADVPDYDTKYVFEIEFRPKDIPDAERIQRLVRSITTSVDRVFDIKNLQVTGDKNSIDISWQAPEFKGNENYVFKVFRTELGDPDTNEYIDWEEVGSLTVTDKSRTQYTYTDKKNLETCPTYYYKVAVTMLENKTFELPVELVKGASLTGQTRVTAITASKGENGQVKISWDVDQIGVDATRYEVKRTVKGKNKWVTLYKTSGTSKNYFYEDNSALPGQYYDYKVVWIITCGENEKRQEIVDDGFCRALGTVSGRISYGTGTAVDGARVTLVRAGDDESGITQFYSLRTQGAGDGVFLALDNTSLTDNFANSAYSVQMLVRPDGLQEGTTPTIFDLGGKMQLLLGVYDEANGYPIVLKKGDAKENTGLFLPANAFTSLTLAVDASGIPTVTCVSAIDSLTTFTSTGTYKTSFDATESTGICLGGSYTSSSSNAFRGYIDEMRVFSGKALTQAEILKNYNHSLVGTEEGLFAYWTVDEGISGQTTAYDYSKTSGVTNGNHGRLGPSTVPTNAVLPTEHQFGLFGYTDLQGNYTICGVPFTGEGTTYMVVPTKGIHEFSPSYATRYVGNSALIHNGVDFEDVSSFPVSGHVYYAGTNYPVEGVQFAVDGTVCSKDGELITTDAQGQFTISVPIGDHFIKASLVGHEFTNEGRYPEDPNGTGTRLTFDREVKNLEFTDATLVNFTGKVVGGDIEGKKAVGFGLSKNNIGMTELVLTPTDTRYDLNVVRTVNGAVVDYAINDKEVAVASATSDIKSKAKRGAGTEHAKQIVITTDSLTGEFSAMVPPLMYNVSAPRVLATDETVGSAATIDLTQPNQELSDTLYNETGGIDRLYTYNVKHAVTYHSKPQFLVTQSTNSDGGLGKKEYTTTDNLGAEFTVSDIYTIGENGKPIYKYGAPIFVELERYYFEIKAYEEYVNNEGINPVISRVPLRGLEVTVSNALSSEQKIYAINNPDGGAPGTLYEMTENKLVLDDEGSAVYMWKAGLPNITEPYKRTISMSYEIDDRFYMWDPAGDGSNMQEGIVLGFLPTGNNFVTEGPTLLEMILRDPPGTASSASWTKGSVKTNYSYSAKTFSSENNIDVVTHLGAKTEFGGGFGFMVLTESEALVDVEVGVNINYQNESGKSWSSTISTEKAISTSGEPEYVGANGDLFIGSSNNLIYGMARNLDFRREGGTVSLGVNDAYTTGLQFQTEFAYTANYIENVLIPNLESLRNSKLKYVTNVNNYTPKGDEVVYLTTLRPGDAGYATNNNDPMWGKNLPLSSQGKSYTMKVGNENNSYNDEIVWYNSQIASWKKWLAINEQEKVRAYEERKADTQNYSFEAGSTITYTATNENGKGKSYESQFQSIAHLGAATGFKFAGIGLDTTISTDTGGGTHSSSETTETDIASFSYTLAETGDDDAITVDVYDYGKYSPIFRTRGGQTSGPYEGEVKTKYYRPGTTIMEATMQIEAPKIQVDVATVSDVPAGQPANYTLRMTNESQTNEDVYYTLMMIDETNPDGAKLTIDGQPLTDGRIIKIPAGETVTKALQLTQTNLGVLHYENIGIVLASQSQYDPTSTWEQIADTVYVTAHFAPSSSSVDMNLSRTTLNTSVGDKLTISFSNFDRTYLNLKAFRIQYKRQGDTDWNLLREYVVGGKVTTSTSQPLPSEGTTVSYDFDMHSFSDGRYVFRVISVCTYGNVEIYNSSEEMAVVKDMQKPGVLGLPTPSNGVLTAADDISVTFNENILKDEILESKNILVTGVLNGAEVDHTTALNLAEMTEAATTEAAINLSDKSFAFDLWINAKAAGTILSHGSGNARFAAAIDKSNKLVVTIGTDTYTSVKTIPMNKWVFLHMSYERTAPGGILNAAAASDDSNINLFSNTTVAQYTGNGTLAVGQNLNASIHELCLWDEARSAEESLADRSRTKRPSTRHLIGYWKMNEGEGTAIRDYSRSRNMTSAAESWYINNENKAVKLSGMNRLGIGMAECSPLETDDYAVELWMRAGTQSGETQIMQSGETGLWLTNAGLLRLTSGDNTFEAGTTPLTDNAWHHVALNVQRNGNAAVYVDGNRTLATSARKVGNIASDTLYVGARRGAVVQGEYQFNRYLKGQIDEVRVWNATVNSELLRSNRKVRLTGKEPGLVAYYPFETKTLNSYNQVVTTTSDADLVSGKHAAVNSKTFPFTNEAPALRPKPTEENVDFTFTASDDKIVITLKEDETSLDGCTLNFSVRNVRDVNGNYSDAVCWSAFVNRRQLAWSNSTVEFTKKVGEPLSFNVDVVNNGGKQQMWEISGMPSWLSADTDNGTTDPLGQDKVTFTVAPATPIGNYSQTIYLTGGDAIEVPLTLDLTVTGDEPDWTVSTSDYEFTMNMIAQLSILGTPSSDPTDKVAVFIGDECRGVARPVYSQRYDNYFVLLNIYGNDSDNNEELSFRAYDASTGMTYPKLESSTGKVVFKKDVVLGSYPEPVVLNALDLLEQVNNLSNGWNWTALYVAPDDMSMPTVLAPLTGNITVAKSQTGFMEPTGSGWNGTVITMNNREMYKLHLSTPAAMKVIGKVPDASKRTITASKGWNWIAYNNTFVVSLDDAFAGLQPETGDVVKGQNGFATYDGYEWAGSLALLEPGQGYMLYSVTDSKRTFSYPSAATSSKIAKARQQRVTPESYFTPVDYHRFPDNMSLIARITFDNEELSNAEVGVYADNECRSHAFTNDAGLAYVSIPGDEKTTLTFKLVHDGMLYTSETELEYSSDGIIGSTDQPFVINFGNSSGISLIELAEEECEWYTVSGMKLGAKPTVPNVYIRKRYDAATRRIISEKVVLTDNDVK